MKTANKSGQVWADRRIELLVAAFPEANKGEGRCRLSALRISAADRPKILDEGEAANLRAGKSGKRGRTRQSKAASLLWRLRTQADDVWRFTSDHDAPFSNSLAEQAVRRPKVKQKISGGFRTQNGTATFCTLRSSLATLHKRGNHLFHALTLTFQGQPPQPRFN